MRTICFLPLVLLATSFGLTPTLAKKIPETDPIGEGRRRLMSDELMDEIKAAYSLQETANPPIHFLSPKKMILSADGVKYPLRGLDQVSIMSKDAKVLVDGKEVQHNISLWQGAVEGATVFMRKNAKGIPNYVNIRRDRRSTSFVALDSDGEENILVAVKVEDADKEKLKQYHLKAKEAPEEANMEVREIEKTALEAKLKNEEHSVQKDGACDNQKELEVAIAFDHTFCSKQGGESNALAKVETLVAMTSNLYAPLCIKLKISAIDGHCNASSDPYRSMDMTRSGCGTGGLLVDFKNYWNDNISFQNIQRDAAHIFVGSSFSNDRGTIGCAWVGALCNSISYGVNDMSFTSNEDWLANLFAHELGHNCGASHSSSGTIMSSSINTSGLEWADDSITSITSYVGRSQCVETVDGDNGNDGGIDGDGDDIGDSPGDEDMVKIKNGNKCLTVPKGETEANTELSVVRCNKRDAERQSWIFNGNRLIQAIADSQMCAQPSQVSKGNPIVLKKCTGERKQRWKVSDDGAIRYIPGKDLCLKKKNTVPILGKCAKAEVQSDRKWTVEFV